MSATADCLSTKNNAPEHIQPSVPGRFAFCTVLLFLLLSLAVPLSGKESLLHSVQHGGAACGKVYAALQIAGVGGAQRAVTADFNGRALGKGTGCHNDLVGIARFVCRFGADKAVHRRAGLDACAEPLQRGGTAGIKASTTMIMVLFRSTASRI